MSQVEALNERIEQVEDLMCVAMFAGDIKEAEAVFNKYRNEPHVAHLQPLRYELAFLRERRRQLTEGKTNE